MAQFKSGDVVGLKSGGPVMTVQHYSDTEYVVCTWFDGKSLKRDVFHEASLQPTAAQAAIVG
jgi:uncharacterized protein YodC (DUF2158 family)